MELNDSAMTEFRSHKVQAGEVSSHGGDQTDSRSIFDDVDL